MNCRFMKSGLLEDCIEIYDLSNALLGIGDGNTMSVYTFVNRNVRRIFNKL